jgi:hypothetical protein
MATTTKFTAGQWARLTKFLLSKGEPVSAPARRVLSVIAMHEAMSRRVPGAEELARQADVGLNRLRGELLPELEGFRLITVTPGRGRRPATVASRTEVIGPWMTGRLDLAGEEFVPRYGGTTSAVCATEPGDYSRAGVLAAVVGEIDPGADANFAPSEGAEAAAVAGVETAKDAEETEGPSVAETEQQKRERQKRQALAELGLLDTATPTSATSKPEPSEEMRQRWEREQAAFREGVRQQQQQERLDEAVEQAVSILRGGGVRVPRLTRDEVERWTGQGMTLDDWRKCAERAAAAGMNRFDYLRPMIREMLGLDYQPPSHPKVSDMGIHRAVRDGWEIEDGPEDGA